MMTRCALSTVDTKWRWLAVKSGKEVELEPRFMGNPSLSAEKIFLNLERGNISQLIRLQRR